MRTRIAAAAAFILSLTLTVSVASGLGRDADGSRMQARAMTIGETASDSLTPPSDAIDWRYVRIASAQSVTLTLKVTPGSAQGTVSLANAMGKSLVRGRTGADGTFTTTTSLDPGLYYIAVGSQDTLSYTLTLK